VRRSAACEFAQQRAMLSETGRGLVQGLKVVDGFPFALLSRVKTNARESLKSGNMGRRWRGVGGGVSVMSKRHGAPLRRCKGLKGSSTVAGRLRGGC
jgi:hypothetical protein